MPCGMLDCNDFSFTFRFLVDLTLIYIYYILSHFFKIYFFIYNNGMRMRHRGFFVSPGIFEFRKHNFYF